MPRFKLSKAASYLAYSQRKLDEATDPAQVRFWQEKVRFYAQALDGRCKRCGRPLEDPASVERGYGSECTRLVERVSA